MAAPEKMIRGGNPFSRYIKLAAIPFCPVDGSTQQKDFPSSYISYRWKAMEKSCLHEPSKEKVRWLHNKLSHLFIIHITKMLYDVT